jgi:hypothetical protein
MGNKRHWFGKLLGGAKPLNHWTLVQEQRNWSLSSEDSTFFSDNDLHRNTRPNQTHGNAITTQAQRMLIRRKIILPEDSGNLEEYIWGLRIWAQREKSKHGIVLWFQDIAGTQNSRIQKNPLC